MNESVLQLDVLRAEMVGDLMLCTNREQHIRLTTRINRLDSILEQLRETV